MFIYSRIPLKYSHMSGSILLCDLYIEHFDKYQARLFPWRIERMWECVQRNILIPFYSQEESSTTPIFLSRLCFKFQRITNGLMRSFNFVKMWNHLFCTLESYNGTLYPCQAHTSMESCYTMLYYKYREVERVCGSFVLLKTSSLNLQDDVLLLWLWERSTIMTICTVLFRLLYCHLRPWRELCCVIQIARLRLTLFT